MPALNRNASIEPMTGPRPRASFEARWRRATEKRESLLWFLATGEKWTTVEHAALLFGRTESAARNTIDALVEEGALKAMPLRLPPRHGRPGSRRKAYGITRVGLELIDADGVPFDGNLGKPWHHLHLQRAHLYALEAGWTWICESRLMTRENGRLAHSGKVPDALAITDTRLRLAKELDLSRETDEGTLAAVRGHAINIFERDIYDGVVYLTVTETLRRSLTARLVRALEIAAEEFGDELWYRFQCLRLDAWGDLAVRLTRMRMDVS